MDAQYSGKVQNPPLEDNLFQNLKKKVQLKQMKEVLEENLPKLIELDPLNRVIGQISMKVAGPRIGGLRITDIHGKHIFNESWGDSKIYKYVWQTKKVPKGHFIVAVHTVARKEDISYIVFQLGTWPSIRI